MTTAVIFSRENTLALRAVVLPGEGLWFVAADAFALVGCVHTPGAMKRFSADEWRQIGADNPLGLHRQTRVINERALGKLAVNGRARPAGNAAPWLIHHVLPTAYTLRATGARP